MIFVRVFVAGAGLMGHGIAQVPAAIAREVTVYEPGLARAAAGLARIAGNLDRAVAKRRLTVEARDAILARLTGTADLEDAAGELRLQRDRACGHLQPGEIRHAVVAQHRSDTAPGDFAQAYVIAHEVGHHVQTLLGINEQVRQQQQQDPDSANQLSVAMEFQADLEAGDLEEGLNAVVGGDDRIQTSAGAAVKPKSGPTGPPSSARSDPGQGSTPAILRAATPSAGSVARRAARVSELALSFPPLGPVAQR